ncbi:OB-fold nucleic acid binding domain-containing protein [Streptomyces tendae]|uniref:OB-fold nucleic acid binding domain-containing protein n=1 Tax=Streptomyces tendae TaxID=1932 RepID=UPI003EBFF879
MQDRTNSQASAPTVCATPSYNQTAPVPGRLLVEYMGDLGPATRRLDMVPAATLVAVTGTVNMLHVTGREGEPRAVFTVTGSTAESAQCVMDTERYLDLWDHLVEGTRVRLSGRVRRPVAKDAGYIEILTLDVAPTSVAVQAVSA